MTLVAHAGHWLVNLAYVIPLLALVVVLIVGKIQDRRAGDLPDDPEDR